MSDGEQPASGGGQPAAGGDASGGDVGASATALAFMLHHLLRVLGFSALGHPGDSYALWQFKAWGSLREFGLAHMGLLAQVQASDPQHFILSAGVALVSLDSFDHCATTAVSGGLADAPVQGADAADLRRSSHSSGGGEGGGGGRGEGGASTSAGGGEYAAAAVAAAGGEGSSCVVADSELMSLVGRLCLRLCRAAHLLASGPAAGRRISGGRIRHSSERVAC